MNPAHSLLGVVLVSFVVISAPAQTKTPAAPKENEPVELSVFEVNSDRDRGYAASQTLIGSRTNTPVKDIPQTISILTAEFLTDLAADSLNDAMRYMAGVEELGQVGRQESRFMIRGFSNAVPSKGGIKSAAPGTSATMTDAHNVERVEVLKGPASLLFGSTAPGGLINTVMKKPREQAATILKFTTSNYNLLKPEVDINRPLNEKKTVLTRFIGMWSDEDDFRNDVHFRRLSLFPSATWRISKVTDLTVSVEYVEREMTPPGNMVENRLQSAFIPDVPLTFNSSGPLNVRDDWSVDVTYDLRHQFNPAWSLRHAVRWERHDEYRSSTIGGIINPDLVTLNGQSNDVHLDAEAWVTQNDLAGTVKVGRTTHKILLGGDYGRSDEHDMRFRANTTPVNYRILANPGRGPVAPAWPAPPVYPTAPRIRRGADDTSYGAYFNDSIYLFDDRLIAVLGVRHDRLKQGATNYLAASPAWTYERHKATTQRYGSVFKPNQVLSVYAGYSESFVPTGGANPDGERFKPETGKGFETGFTATLMDGRLNSRFAFADTDQTNLLLPDPDPVRAGQGYRVQTGLVNSKAFEVEVTASPVDNWSLIASYTHLNTEITGHTPDSARLWNRYEFRTGRLAGLSAGFGWIYVSDRNKNGPTFPYFELDAYNRFDGLIVYRGRVGNKRFKLQLNINNIFQEEYINNGRVPGNPETEYRLSAEYSF